MSDYIIFLCKNSTVQRSAVNKGFILRKKSIIVNFMPMNFFSGAWVDTLYNTCTMYYRVLTKIEILPQTLYSTNSVFISGHNFYIYSLRSDMNQEFITRECLVVIP